MTTRSVEYNIYTYGYIIELVIFDKDDALSLIFLQAFSETMQIHHNYVRPNETSFTLENIHHLTYRNDVNCVSVVRTIMYVPAIIERKW